MSPSIEQPFPLHGGGRNAGCHGEEIAVRAAAVLSLPPLDEGTTVVLS